MNKVVVGLSGGVDSSVAALLLKRAGFEVLGVYLKCYWTYVGCQSDQDRASAAKVASFLEIPFEVWDFEKEYRATVVEYFYDEYKKGRTPNPDVVCNREIKFGLFAKRIQEIENASYIATGHYARIGIRAQSSEFRAQSCEEEWILPKFCQGDGIPDSDLIRPINVKEFVSLTYKKMDRKGDGAGISGKFVIMGGEDLKKDQSYFLYDIDSDVIEHTLFPLGNLTKKQVRSIAKEVGLPSADRPDSTGICFIGAVNVENFLKERIKEHEGEVVDINGDIIGRHKGIEFYTIGQRHGFQVVKSSKFPSAQAQGEGKVQSGPWYVVGKDIQNNRLIVGMGEERKSSKFKVPFGPRSGQGQSSK